jgi:hypothetical protein
MPRRVPISPRSTKVGARRDVAEHEGPDISNRKRGEKMLATVQKQLLELETQVWKARAHAKQKWLERTLAEPARNPRDAERRTMWINQALNVVKRGQDEVKYQSALMDAYAEHLSVLEMSLIAAAERVGAEGKRSERT